MDIKFTPKPSQLGDPKVSIKRYFFTFLFCVAITVFLHLIGDTTPFLSNLVISLSVGFSIHTLVPFVASRFSEKSHAVQWTTVALTLIIAVIIGLSLGFWLTDVGSETPGELEHTALLASLTIGVFFGSLAIWFFYTRAQLHKAEAFTLQFKLETTSKAKQLSEAKLNLLQAQIEPHFLFNTLATVHSLIEDKPQLASAMLERVNDYLRSALDHSRSQNCLLSHEIDLLRAYLDIMKMRMGDRLNFEIIVDDNVRKQTFPPMLLQPLVENAIKHGLEPKIDGGNLQVSGMIKDKQLCLDVIDGGIGFTHFKEEGVGLSNVRERLKTLYGDAATFSITALGKRGVRASICIPMDMLDLLSAQEP